MTYLSYQTLTIDLYAPLLLLLLLFSLLYTLLSCSCSRLSDRYRLASRYNRPSSELSSEQEDPNAVLARYVPTLEISPLSSDLIAGTSSRFPLPSPAPSPSSVYSSGATC